MVQHDKQILPVLAWGLIQLAILGIGASGFPLWAHHPFPRESLAFQEMLVGQMVAFALFFPVLIGSRWDVAIAIAVMMPADELAGVMSNSPQNGLWIGFICVALWNAGLGGLRLAVKSPTVHLMIGLGATLLTAGGSLFDYLRWESAATNGQPADFLPISILPNLCAAVKTGSNVPWFQAALPLITLSLTLIIQLSITTRSRPSTSLHSAS